MNNDGTQGNKNGRNEIRQRITSKNWIEKNGQPGEKSEPVDNVMRKRQGVFKTTWKKTLEELLE